MGGTEVAFNFVGVREIGADGSVAVQPLRLWTLTGAAAAGAAAAGGGVKVFAAT